MTEEIGLREKKSAAVKRHAIALRIVQALANQKKQHDAFIEELKPLLDELGTVSIDSLIQIKVDSTPAQSVAKAIHIEIDGIERKLQGDDPESIMVRREKIASQISDAKAKLGERQRQYVLYKEELAKWEKAKLDIVGTPDKHGTITWLTAQLESLAALPAYLNELKADRNQLSMEIHGQIHAMVNEYQRLYGPPSKPLFNQQNKWI